MSTGRILARELADMAMVLTEIVRQEFKASASDGVPTFTQFKMLHSIKRGVRQVGKLAEAFGNSQPATSMMVEAMVKDGLLTRVPNPGDRRQVELHLTPKALASIDAVYTRAFETIAERLVAVPATQKKRLAKQIRSMTELLREPEE